MRAVSSLAVIAVLTGLLVAGCSSEGSRSPADDAQLAQYQTCLATASQKYDDLVKQLGTGQPKPDGKSVYSTTEWAMMVCVQYQPQ